MRCAAAVTGTCFGGKNVVHLDGQLAGQGALLGRREKAVTLQYPRIADDEGQIGSAVSVIGLRNCMDFGGQCGDAGASAGLQQEAGRRHGDNVILQGRAGRDWCRRYGGLTGGVQRGFHQFSLFQVERIPHAQKGAQQGTAKGRGYSGRATAARG